MATRQTVLMASDSPQLPARHGDDAFAALDRFGAVLLPTYDGGYSLIGQRHGVDILGTTPMSTRTVFDDLCGPPHIRACRWKQWRRHGIWTRRAT